MKDTRYLSESISCWLIYNHAGFLQVSRRRYEQAMQGYKPKNAMRDPNAPKQPLSAYFFFSSEERLKVKSDHPSYSICEVAKELGRYFLVSLVTDFTLIVIFYKSCCILQALG